MSGIGKNRERSIKALGALTFGQGISLKDALALENNAQINPDSWQRALQRHPEFVHPYSAAKADFLAKSIQRLIESEDLANLRWLLERRYPDLFARPAPISVNVSQNTIAGLPEEYLERARAYARQL